MTEDGTCINWRSWRKPMQKSGTHIPYWATLALRFNTKDLIHGPLRYNFPNWSTPMVVDTWWLRCLHCGTCGTFTGFGGMDKVRMTTTQMLVNYSRALETVHRGYKSVMCFYASAMYDLLIASSHGGVSYVSQRLTKIYIASCKSLLQHLMTSTLSNPPVCCIHSTSGYATYT